MVQLPCKILILHTGSWTLHYIIIRNFHNFACFFSKLSDLFDDYIMDGADFLYIFDFA